MKYTICQLPHEHPNLFMSLSFAMEHGGVHVEDYIQVYSDKIEGIDVKELDQTDAIQILEKIYMKFNTSRPEDFTGHSLSVSDLVKIEEVGIFFCDSFGWKKIS